MQSGSVADVYMDFQGLAELKAEARQDQSAGLEEVARQFESLLMNMMLKSMRQAKLGEGLLDNDQSLFYRDMYDQQLALHLAEGGGLGLADVIRRQLGGDGTQADASPDRSAAFPTPVRSPDRASAARVTGTDNRPVASAPVADPPGAGGQEADPAAWSADDFVRNLWPWAREAAGELGLAPQALLAQAALETGWGAQLPRLEDGTPSRNLFGIKADARWDGKKIRVDTLEHEQGLVVRKAAYFRAYDSFRESFADYVEFLRSNPRYREALTACGDSRDYFSALQKAGYATDPQYADKIHRLLDDPRMARALARFKPDQHQPL